MLSIFLSPVSEYNITGNNYDMLSSSVPGSIGCLLLPATCRVVKRKVLLWGKETVDKA